MALNENAQKWVSALRSGEFEQGKDRLRTEEGRFCCLGVACVAYMREHPEAYWDKEEFVPSDLSLGQDVVLPDDVQEWLGLYGNQGEYRSNEHGSTMLTSDNDNRNKTFNEIADIIESEPVGMFI